MKNFVKMLIAFCLFGYGSTLLAQETVSSAGGNASGEGGSVSYTIGQIVYTSTTGPEGSISHGVQHPYEIWIVTGFDNAYDISLECMVFPNPTSHHIFLKVKNDNLENLSYNLFNLNGKLLKHQKIVDPKTTIQMEHLNPAIYFLKITKGGELVKTFKINKK